MAIKRQTKHKLGRGTGIVFCALIYAILFLPIVIVVANSFNGNTEKPYLSWGGFSLRWYVHLFQNGPLLASFGNTMLLAITTTVLATALGTLGAVGLYRYKFPGRNLIAGGALLSFTLSIDDVVVSYFVYGQDLTFPLKVMQSIKGGVVPDVNALSTLILLGTVAIVVITQSGMIDKWRERRATAKLSQERGR